jgi:hypothetical protein
VEVAAIHAEYARGRGQVVGVRGEYVLDDLALVRA